MKLAQFRFSLLFVFALAPLAAVGCGGADPSSDEEDPTAASSTTSEALVIRGWNHVCRLSGNHHDFLFDNGQNTNSANPRGEYVGNGHAVYAYGYAPGGDFVHVGDNVGKGHFGWIQKENLCNGK